MDTFTMTDDFNPGGLKDRIDPRDYKWSEIGYAMTPFDWNKGWDINAEVGRTINQPDFTLPVKNQYDSYSCGGQAWSTYGGALEAIFTGTFEERSAKFIYAQTHVAGGGSGGRDNSALVIRQGWGKENMTRSYEPSGSVSEGFMERAIDITDAARQDAKLARALSYASSGTDIDSIAQAAEANHGVIIGINGANNGTWHSTIPMAPIAGQNLWQHWAYVGKAGMMGGKKAVAIFNSWGVFVGDKGWQWITEDYFKGLEGTTVWDSWTQIYNNNPVPTTINHDFQLDMAYGQSSNEVMALQQALQVTGDFPESINPTAYYGNATAAAVFKFQVRHGITPADRNHAGPKTRAALNALFNH